MRYMLSAIKIISMYLTVFTFYPSGSNDAQNSSKDKLILKNLLTLELVPAFILSGMSKVSPFPEGLLAGEPAQAHGREHRHPAPL
jgi:hypothetical protein